MSLPHRPVTVIGDVNVDLIVHLPDAHGAGRDLTGSVPQLFGGGAAANTAVALARLDVPTRFIGAVGDDGFGRACRTAFEQEGIDTAGLVMLPDAFTPQVIALIQPDGERHLVIFPPTGGADRLLHADHLNAGAIRSAGWLHTSGIGLRESPIRETVLDALRIGRAAGVPISLDLNLRIELWGYDDAMRRTLETAVGLADVVFGSGDEELIPVTGAATVQDAARQLSGWMTHSADRVVVARLGKDGALAFDHGTIHRRPGCAVPVVDTLGAGDAFNAGYIAAILKGAGIGEALEAGNSVAAYKIAHGGARSTPTTAQLDAWTSAQAAPGAVPRRTRQAPRCEG
ncbi:MAG: sugar kinase [bacterium]|nr:sugar kinase [bacterium]